MSTTNNRDANFRHFLQAATCEKDAHEFGPLVCNISIDALLPSRRLPYAQQSNDPFLSSLSAHSLPAPLSPLLPIDITLPSLFPHHPSSLFRTITRICYYIPLMLFP